MKKLGFILLISIVALHLKKANAQEEIHYGSNKGMYIEIQNTGIYYEEYGNGTPLLLFHGGLGSISYFRKVIPELSNHFRIIAVDLPGHGRSYHADSISYQLMNDYMSEMIDVMEFDSVYILGCSMGSILSLHLAYNRPDKVKRIISDGGIINAEGSRLDLFEFIRSLGSVDNRSQRWIDRYNDMNPQKDRMEELLRDLSRTRFDLPFLSVTEIRNIKARTMILMGDRDGIVKLEHGLALYNAIEGSEFCVIPAAGHCVCNQKPALVSKIIINFLTKK